MFVSSEAFLQICFQISSYLFVSASLNGPWDDLQIRLFRFVFVQVCFFRIVCSDPFLDSCVFIHVCLFPFSDAAVCFFLYGIITAFPLRNSVTAVCK
jgi:hypothetical protein